ncbi:hypothetical protein [Rhodovulum sp. MB263]|uniref:hypothetical protein n=1 Tax=Rhodovulum sp. (strain MB263) TaxID=308754 RepID=UPI0012DB0539|nr:hypothetical protein [Rhodovulum sp. MB263]
MSGEIAEVVISEARKAYLEQICAYLGISLLFGWVGCSSSGPAAQVVNSIAGLGLIFLFVALYCFLAGHFRDAKRIRGDILPAAQHKKDPDLFWRCYSDLFPMAWK